MRLIIAGSRSIYGPDGVEAVKQAIREINWKPTEIISGGANGVDKIGEEIAKEYGIDLVVFPANWKKHGKAAGYKRNRKMVWYANLFNNQVDCPDNLKGGLVAIWNGTSKGTENIIELARRNKLPFHVHKMTG